MTYTKPEVDVLGSAVNVVESNLTVKPGAAFDGQAANPAYDLDE